MFNRLKRLFKRKRYAPIYPAGGFTNPADLHSRVRSGEMVVSEKDLRLAIMRALEDIEEDDYPIDVEDVKKRIIECAEAFGFSDKVAEKLGNESKALKRKQHANCPNCGAVMHGNICYYCGTEL